MQSDPIVARTADGNAVLAQNTTPPDLDMDQCLIITAPAHSTGTEMEQLADAPVDIAEQLGLSSYVLVLREGVTAHRVY